MTEPEFAAWRTQYGLVPTDRELARVLGIHWTHVYKLRSGERRPNPTLRQLMRAIDRLVELGELEVLRQDLGGAGPGLEPRTDA